MPYDVELEVQGYTEFSSLTDVPGFLLFVP